MHDMLNDNSLNMSGYSIDEIFIGMKRSVSKTITEADLQAFAGITGDLNPVHMNAEYAKGTRFGERIAHGMLTASFFSTIVGMCIPGADAIYLSQNLEFLLPVKIGDTITATGEVISRVPDKRIATLMMTATNQQGQVVVQGEGKVMATK